MARRRAIGLCRCGSRKPLLRCCAPFLDGDRLPETPEELMRSRYTAYALGRARYIIETTDPDGPMWQDDAPVWATEIEAFSRAFRFDGVVIHESESDGDDGRVRFTAVLRTKSDDASFDEDSVFVRRDGRWLYHGGT